jgi:hypothetical protein
MIILYRYIHVCNMRQGARKEASYLVIKIILINYKKRRHTCRCPRDTEPFALENRLSQKKNSQKPIKKEKFSEAYHNNKFSEILRIHCLPIDYVYFIWSRIC